VPSSLTGGVGTVPTVLVIALLVVAVLVIACNQVGMLGFNPGQGINMRMHHVIRRQFSAQQWASSCG
jgi:hypothetical protein